LLSTAAFDYLIYAHLVIPETENGYFGVQEPLSSSYMALRSRLLLIRQFSCLFAHSFVVATVCSAKEIHRRAPTPDKYVFGSKTFIGDDANQCSSFMLAIRKYPKVTTFLCFPIEHIGTNSTTSWI
jgi:hypothetical protein